MITNEIIEKLINEGKVNVSLQIKNEKKEIENRYLKFFNTNLGIFILSSCVISILTWGYAQLSNSIAENSKNNSRVEMLKAELKKRTLLIDYYLLKSDIDGNDIRQMNAVFTGDINTIIQYGGQLYDNYYYTYEEFKTIGVDEIVSELSRLDNELNFNDTMDAYREAYQLYMKLKRESMDGLRPTRSDNQIVQELSNKDKDYFNGHIKPKLFY